MWPHGCQSQQREGIRKAKLREGKGMGLSFVSSTVGLTLCQSASQGESTCYSLSQFNGLHPQRGKILIPVFLPPLTLGLVIV